ncbi:DNA alkylation repair enzyme [hydrothermal vent metagenome]|uniref:DNA alkylation repair enzyme n=1 Tax=hydrothermal vent metagenome TaxID=652676 RepID=A0A1W1ECM5_9ZZZZ
MKEKYLLKDELFNQIKVEKIANEIKEVYSSFDDKKFKRDVLKQFPSLELKERMYHIRNMLAIYLPSKYEDAVIILVKALPEELDTNKYDDDFGEFIYASYADFVCYYGCKREYLEFSLNALKEMTKCFSVEFAIRDFINNFPEETFKMLEECSLSLNYHQRRLASEGLRPLLPWAKKIDISYMKPILILDNIFYDKTRYVTRSVANHMNDISKLDASFVVDTLKRWEASKKQNSKEMEFIVNHSLRTLVKIGDENALLFLGYKKNAKIKVSTLTLDKEEICIGENLVFNFTIQSKEECSLLIDYIIHFRTKVGKRTHKVYKIKKVSLNRGESRKIEKRHHFKANMSTRKLHAGEHRVEIQINGLSYGFKDFLLN